MRREAFTRDELKALFGDMGKYVQATEGVSSRFWAPLIALYSGMRLEEICPLHLSDIIKEDGVLCFSINEERGGSGDVKHVKSSAGIRKVPVILICGMNSDWRSLLPPDGQKRRRKSTHRLCFFLIYRKE